MRDFFQEQLKELNRELVKMGADCEEIIALASDSLTGWNRELAEHVSIIGARIDEGYRTVENICLKLLLRQQPVARDLRVISAAMKMITDMERIGDQAEDIVDLIPKMEHRADEKYPKIREMAKAAQQMVTEAVDAYVRQDLELAYAVMKHDDVVDDYFNRVKTGIIGIIAENPTDGEYALDLLMIAKYFERIGDHCTNIAEWVEFSVTGVHKNCQ
ncbi:MAG: phosphate signaling complex protein PhoU [Oscillospiraceae bacterium]|nr:phosphate signaling complex protein PhoU [Oscillospiraceae bacterium]